MFNLREFHSDSDAESESRHLIDGGDQTTLPLITTALLVIVCEIFLRYSA